jgi:hypothetical protein
MFVRWIDWCFKFERDKWNTFILVVTEMDGATSSPANLLSPLRRSVPDSFGAIQNPQYTGRLCMVCIRDRDVRPSLTELEIDTESCPS